MNSKGNKTYPGLAKAILAFFAILIALGPAVVRSADRKTRSHFTAIAGRPGQDASAKDNDANEQAMRDQVRLEKRLAEAERARKELEKRLEEQVREARRERTQRLKEQERLSALERAVKAKEMKAVESNSDDSKAPVRRLGFPKGLRSPFVIGRKEPPFEGYLAYKEPRALRFTEDYRSSKRSPSQALPEFSMMAPSSDTLLSEVRLSEKDIKRNELLRQAVVKLEPHVIVSGAVDTTIPRIAVESERFVVEDESQEVLRPEEVLIFFENQTGGNTRTIVPQFAPAVPNRQPAVDSKANYRVEQ